METKLTYENIKELLDRYFYGFQDTVELDPAEAERRIAMCFDTDIETRRGNYPTYFRHEFCAWALVNQNPTHRYDITIDDPSGYCIIDEEQGLCFIQMKEDVFDTELDRVFRCSMNLATFHCIIKDGMVKFDRELITRQPACYQVDQLGVDRPYTTVNWLNEDYSDFLAQDERLAKEKGGNYNEFHAVK